MRDISLLFLIADALTSEGMIKVYRLEIMFFFLHNVLMTFSFVTLRLKQVDLLICTPYCLLF